MSTRESSLRQRREKSSGYPIPSLFFAADISGGTGASSLPTAATTTTPARSYSTMRAILEPSLIICFEEEWRECNVQTTTVNIIFDKNPPGSGKTSLLLALAGELGSELKVIGRVTYNGHEMDEFIPKRTTAYISQHDLHVGEMTVRETLAFCARCQGVGTRYDMLTELSRREKQANIKPDHDFDLSMKATNLTM